METGEKVALKVIKAMDNLRQMDMVSCKYCGSQAVVRNGKRRDTQYWLCKDCGHGFVGNEALPKGKYPMDIIAKAVYDYYAGVSLNNIRRGIEQQTNNLPSDSSVYGWVERLTEIGLDEAKKHHPVVGEKWIGDETVVTLNGKKYWLINIIDSDTRFLLASKLSTNRSIRDIKSTLEVARDKADKAPKWILSDGWKAYIDSIEQVFGADTQHIVSTPFESKELSTNLVERWHGTLKDRLKTMRGMDKSDTTQMILDGFVFFYNYLRRHESLADRTPAEVADTKFPYKDWLDIIKSETPHEERTLVVGTVKIGGAYLPIRKPYRKRIKPKRKPIKRKRREEMSVPRVIQVRR